MLPDIELTSVLSVQTEGGGMGKEILCKWKANIVGCLCLWPKYRAFMLNKVITGDPESHHGMEWNGKEQTKGDSMFVLWKCAHGTVFRVDLC